MTNWLYLIGVLFSLIGLALVSGIEAALVSISPLRVRQLVEQGGHAAAVLVQRLTERTEDLLIGQAVAVNVFLLLAATLTTVKVHDWGWGAIVWANLLVFLALLVFGIILPKTFCIEYAEQVALRTAPLAAALAWLLTPAVALLNAISLALLHLLTALHVLPGVVRAAPPAAYSEEDLKDLITAGEQSGEVETTEREMLHGAIEFAETSADEVMVPRTELVALPIDSTLEEAIGAFMESGHSRLPVYRENADDILGVLYIKDLLIRLKLAEDTNNPPPAIGDLLRPAYFVPESKKSDELLRELQRRRVHLAIVVDEYGGTAGIITIEDLLEEIVGDIIDEYDVEQEDVTQLPDGTAMVSGQTSLDEIADVFDIEIPETEAETISGLITEILGRIPEVNDRVVVSAVAFTVMTVAHNRAEQLHVVAVPPAG